MLKILSSTKTKVAVAAGAAAVLFVGGVAWAGGGVNTKYVGGSETQTKVVTETGSFSTSSTDAWVNVPLAKVQIQVPQGAARLATATFSAETSCSATGLLLDGWCAARIVAKKISSPSVVEMRPAVGDDFAMDSGGDEGETWEGNTMDRALKLGQGTWNVWVQIRVSGNGGSFSVDDWYFEVESNKAS